MNNIEYLYKRDNLPDYYDTMYLDGYSPEQIMLAVHRTMYKRYLAQQEQAQRNQQSEDYNININSEVKVKK